MIRPLNLVYCGDNKYGVENHKGERLDPDNNTNKGLGIVHSTKFWKKFLSHPITAFGYDIDYPPNDKDFPNPRFSKHDVIRTLDFWIEHWVYENQKESVLTGTVNVDHEITLKELILVREKIMKMSVKTKFTRARIRISDKLPNNKKKIVFTEAVIGDGGGSSSTVDPFCHKVIKMTREEYERYKNRPYFTAANNIHNDRLSRMIRNMIETQSQLSFEEATTSVPVATGQLQRDITFTNPLVSAGVDNIHTNIITESSLDDIGDIDIIEPQLQIGDVVIWDRQLNRFRRAGIDDDISQTIRLSTETQSPEFLRWVTTGTFVIPEDAHIIVGDMLVIRNDYREIVVAHGTVAEDLHPGDVVRLDGNNRWIKIPPIDIQVSDVID